MSAHPVSLTPGTCEAQRKDLTDRGAIREVVDNGMAATANMT